MGWNVVVGGLRVAVDAADRGAADSLTELFAGCRPLQRHTAHAGQIVWGDGPIDLPTRDADARTRDARFWLDEAGVTAAHDSGVAGVVVGTTVRIGGPTVPAPSSRAVRVAVQLPLSQLLGRSGRHVVHGALLRRGERAVLILGDSGAGKSTAAFAAASSGWEVLGDDMAVLCPTTGGIIGWGFPKPLHVPGELIGAGSLDAAPIVDDARDRVVLPAPSCGDVDGCRVVGVVRVAHSDGRAQITTAPTGTPWIQSLLRSFPVAVAIWGSRQVFATAIGVSKLPSIELRHDTDPATRVPAAADLLDRATASWF